MRQKIAATPGFDALIAGAGIAGAVCARQLADGSRRLLLIDRRAHPGANAAGVLDAPGAASRRSGRTPSTPTANGCSATGHASPIGASTATGCWPRWTASWLPPPSNRTTLNRLYGLQIDGAQVEVLLVSVR